MNEQSLGAISSLIIHSAILILLFSISQNSGRFNKPVVVDFSLSHELFSAEKPKVGSGPAITNTSPLKKTRLKRKSEIVARKVAPPEPKLVAPPLRVIPQPAPIPREELPAKVEKKEAEKQPEPAPQTAEDPQTVELALAEKMPVVSDSPLLGLEAPLDDVFYSETELPDHDRSIPTDSNIEGNEDQQSEGSTIIGGASQSNVLKVNSEQYYLQQHFKAIHEIVRKRIHYPKVAKRMGWSGKVLVSFLVNKNGNVSDIEIVKSSGYPLLDKSAVRTIKRIVCFPKPPLTAKIIIPINFKLKTVLSS